MHEHEALIRSTALSLAYGRRVVLDDVNLEVRPGEFWFFLGPNGEGKTTLLRALLGVIRPLAGELWRHSAFTQRDRIGFVPQRCDIIPTLPTTVREFVQLGLVGIRASYGDRSERFAWALDKVGLAGLAQKSYWSLSGGQRQRALIARALVRRPDVLILDEPTNGLDVAAEDTVLRLLAALHHTEHQTLLFVTHNLALAARYATHVALFHGGRVVSGRRQEVLNRHTLARMYGVGVEISYDTAGWPAVRVSASEGAL